MWLIEARWKSNHRPIEIRGKSVGCASNQIRYSRHWHRRFQTASIMQSRSIISLFITICLVLVSLFGCAAGKLKSQSNASVWFLCHLGSGKAVSDQFQNSPKMHSKNLFAQRLRRGVAKSGQLRRRRQDGGSSWGAQQQGQQPYAMDSQPSYQVSVNDQGQGSQTYGQNPQQGAQFSMDSRGRTDYQLDSPDRTPELLPGRPSLQSQGVYNALPSDERQSLQGYAENYGIGAQAPNRITAYGGPQNSLNSYRRKK